MTSRKLSLLILSFVALSPGISLAGAEDRALKACVDAFAATLPGAHASSVKLQYARHTGGMLTDYYAHEYTFTMRANDRNTSAALASVSCSATQAGAVIALRDLRAREPVTLAAR